MNFFFNKIIDNKLLICFNKNSLINIYFCASFFFLFSTLSQSEYFELKKTSSKNFYFYGPSKNNTDLSKANKTCKDLDSKILDFSFKGLKNETIEMFQEVWNKDGSLGFCFWVSNGSCFNIYSNIITYNFWEGIKKFICFKPKAKISSTLTTQTLTITTIFTSIFNNLTNPKIYTTFPPTSKKNLPQSNPEINKPLAIGLGVAILFFLFLTIAIVLLIFYFCFHKTKNKKKQKEKIYDDLNSETKSGQEYFSISDQQDNSKGDELKQEDLQKSNSTLNENEAIYYKMSDDENYDEGIKKEEEVPSIDYESVLDFEAPCDLKNQEDL